MSEILPTKVQVELHCNKGPFAFLKKSSCLNVINLVKTNLTALLGVLDTL